MTDNKENSNLAIYITITSIITTFVILVVFFVFSLKIDAEHGQWIIDFSESGALGDTISGIASPIFSVLSAILIFYSFKAQIKANILTSEEFEKAQLEKNFFFLLNEFEKILSDADNLQAKSNLSYLDITTKINVLLDIDILRTNASFRKLSYQRLKEIKKKCDEVEYYFSLISIQISEYNLLKISELNKQSLVLRYSLFYKRTLKEILLQINNFDYTIIETWNLEINNNNYRVRLRRIENLKNQIDRLKAFRLNFRNFFVNLDNVIQ